MDFAFLDSGTGGIPYMQYLKDSCPDARCAYLADTRNFPYGEKSSEQIVSAVSEAVELVVGLWHPKAVVLACNTMSVTALYELRRKFPSTPFIGTVPAIKLAAERTHNGRIGLLATKRTVENPYTDNLVCEFAKGCTVFRRGDSRLIDFIEHDLYSSTPAQRREAVFPAVEYFSACNVDTIVLGCTHFIHVADDIQTMVGGGVQVLDSRSGVVRQALKVAFSNSEDSMSSAISTDEPEDRSFFVTGFSDDTEEGLYIDLCRRHGIPWGGILSR